MEESTLLFVVRICEGFRGEVDFYGETGQK